jgi:hypothetical protein
MRQAVKHLENQHHVSERRACRIVGMVRGTLRHRSNRGDQPLRQRLRELASERRRFGYRRLAILLKREGLGCNLKRVYRLYCEEGLMVKRRKGRKRALGTRLPLPKPDSLNQIWSLDFVSDQLADGRRFRILGVMDQCSRECLTLVADTSLPGLRVARELDALVQRRGKPLCIVSDNGTELTSRAAPDLVNEGLSDRKLLVVEPRHLSCRLVAWKTSSRPGSTIRHACSEWLRRQCPSSIRSSCSRARSSRLTTLCCPRGWLRGIATTIGSSAISIASTSPRS